MWISEKSGELYSNDGGTILYPNTILFTETNHHYIAEFFGFSDKYEGLNSKSNKESSADKYFYQFTQPDNISEKAFIRTSKDSKLELHGIRISLNFDENKVTKRFPHFNFHEFSSGGINALGSEVPLSIHNQFKSCFITNSLLINTKDEVYRFKHINCLVMFNKYTSKKNYINFSREKLQESLSDKKMYGLHICKDEQSARKLLSSQFCNIYLSRCNETTIGDFLNQHPTILKRALNAESFLYEEVCLGFRVTVMTVS